ncbi:MAG: hypothetical protein K8R45_12660 [Desulfobacterales bacterium]|nr:hypothetical protein [Desulfobacterales bacterium]
MPEKTIVIQTFGNKAEAEIAGGLLKTAGIKSFVSKDDVGGMYPGLQITGTGVILRVRPRDAGRATEILQGIETQVWESENYSPSKNLIAIVSLLVWVLLPLGGASILIGLTGQRPLVYIGISLVVLGCVLVFFAQARKKKMGLSEPPSKLRYLVIGLAIGVVLTGAVSWYYGVNQNRYDGLYKRDLNGDGKIDEWQTYSKGSLMTAESDHNFDGRADVWWRYENGTIISMKMDTDFNGIFDVSYFFVDNVAYSAEFRPNGAKTVAKKEIFEHGVLKEQWVDKNMDGKFDQKIIFDHLENPIRTIPFR